MNIAYVGDTHGDALSLEKVAKLLKKTENSLIHTVIQVGDFGFFPSQIPSSMYLKSPPEDWMRFSSQILDVYSELIRDIGAEQGLIVMGNHDFCPWPKFKAGSYKSLVPGYDNIYTVPNGHYEEICGIPHFFVGGATSIDRKYRVLDRTWWIEEVIPRDQREIILSKARAVGLMTDSVTLVTHDIVPVSRDGLLPGGFHQLDMCRNFQSFIFEVACLVKPVLAIHGHMHQRYESEVFREGYKTSTIGLSHIHDNVDEACYIAYN